MTNPPVLHLTNNTAPHMEMSEALMYLAWAVVILLVVVKLFQRSGRSPRALSGQRHFTETSKDGWFEIDAPPAPPATPYAIIALIPAAFAAAMLTAIWVTGGHRFEASAWFFWIMLILGVLVFRPMMRGRDRRARNIQPGPFAVGGGMVRLPDGREYLVSGQFVVTRRNSAPYGHASTAHAHHVDLEFGGMSYTLAGGLSDPASMAVYHQVMRRLKGEA